VASQAPLLSVRGVTKEFPGVQALLNVDLDIRAGEVQAVVGENGAGKSTLMKILAGVYQPDAGTILLDGHEVHIGTPRQSMALGIGMIHQELNLAPNLSVAENIFLGRPPTRAGLVDWRGLDRHTHDLLERLGIELDPRSTVEDLSVARQQMVEIAKALSLEARIFIMDEPTSALTDRETATLFDIIARLKAQGVAVVYISHRLEEIFRIADVVTVLRDGHLVGSSSITDTSPTRLIGMMVGRELTAFFPKTEAAIGDPVLQVRGLSRAGTLHDIHFEVRRGEILGIAGLVGAGRTELARALFGIDRMDAGEVVLNGRRVRISSPRQAIDLGLGFVTEDRKLHGLVLGMTVRENASLASLPKLSRVGFLSFSRERQVAQDYVRQLDIRTPGIEQEVVNLSGGNQQKIVLAKWLATRPRVLILDEPTRGIDVGAKAEVHALMSRLAASGVAIIMISSELPEILGMSDRILVVRQGRVSAEYTRDEATQERILASAA
jgi:ABC-type sugar transport system ATPase subunit